MKDDSLSSQNYAMDDEIEEPETQVEDMEENETSSSSFADNSAVDNAFLFPDVEIFCHDEHEPVYEVDTDTVAEASGSSDQLEYDQLHTIDQHDTQDKQNHDNSVDLFFYSMAESTKNLPRISQAIIQCKVLMTVLQIQEKAYENNNDEN